MAKVASLALAFLLALTQSAFSQSDEPLNPAFVDETLSDPFLTPAAQTSGPLDGERLEDLWINAPRDDFYQYAPAEVFADSGDESCASTSATPQRRVPLYDSGVTATYLSPVDGFGVSDIDARTQLVFPLFVKGSPLRLALAGGTTFIQAPASIDVPSRLYGLTAELRWYIPLKETWGIDLGAGGGVFSDLDGSAGKGFRVTGRAILVKDLNPRWKLSGGFLYLGRKNLAAMPIAGAIYTPADDFKVEILFPRPRVMKRVRLNGHREHWVYGGLELFGGNTWAITQSTGAEDTFIYKDNRLLIGYETKAPNRLSGRVEAGYVFTRKVEFENDPRNLDPGGTFMLRAGVTY
jgi:hypothetical protein